MTFPRVSAYPDLAIDRGGDTLAHGGAAAGAVAELIAANPKRVELIVHNNGGTTDTVFIGAAAVSAGNGVKLAAGESITIKTTAAVFFVAGVGTPVTSFLEVSQG